MKKIFLSLTILAVLVCSCNGNSNKNMSVTDSLSQLIGEMNGYGVKGYFKTSPDSAKFNKASFIKGMQVALTADTADASFLMGLSQGVSLANLIQQSKQMDKVELNAKLMLAAFKVALTNDTLKDPQQIQMAVMAIMERAKREAKLNDPAAKQNLEEGEAYIAKFEKEEGAIKTASGLVYKVLQAGNGELFKESDKIMISYEGRHVNGELFDKSAEPVAMSPMGVIPGFKEALLLMSPGAKFEIAIPADLAYGSDGNRAIGPNETLIFVMEATGLAE